MTFYCSNAIAILLLNDILCHMESVKRSQLFERILDLKMSQIKKWFTTAEAAAYLGRSDGAVRNLIYRGKLVARKFGGRNYFNREELDRAIECGFYGN